eukprot:361335-Chlamydomonas_euryale.AAC.14
MVNAKRAWEGVGGCMPAQSSAPKKYDCLSLSFAAGCLTCTLDWVSHGCDKLEGGWLKPCRVRTRANLHLRNSPGPPSGIRP